MCGLAGILFTTKHRSVRSWHYLQDVFTTLLLCNEERGSHAAGLAIMNVNGEAHWYKEAVSATKLIETDQYFNMMEAMTDGVTAVIGHTRWATQGSPKRNRNNHPIVCGKVIGTHNGTISNDDALFRRFGLPRVAEVDSEVLFQMASKHANSHGVNLKYYARDLSEVQGALSAVLINADCPHEVVVIKGNRPLFMRWHNRLGALAYASDEQYLDVACAGGEEAWTPYEVDPMTALSFYCGKKLEVTAMPVDFSEYRAAYNGYGPDWEYDPELKRHVKKSTAKATVDGNEDWMKQISGQYAG